ncbi:MAG: type IV pilus secretin PilQ [Xanthomonadales bacterium]|nr:type IV pilus secretin PilQ [Xanthomonadales bacterium]
MKAIVTNPAQSWTAKLPRRLAMALILLPIGWSSWAQSVLEDVSFSAGSGGSVDIILSVSGGIPDQDVFTTDNPPRIALDLANTTNAVSSRSIEVGSGATRSVSAVEAGGRTRVVIDLFRSAPFETRVEGDRVVVSISGSGGSAIVSNAQRRSPAFSSSASGTGVAVENVDFRRGRNGEGRIIVNFTDAGANVDLSKQGERLRAYIYNASITPELEQRLDVLDFATPVEIIDTLRDGQRIRMDITVRGEYEHLAYQTGNQYVIEVQEYQEEELTPEELILQPPEYTGTRVTFNFQDIPVRAVLQLIADVSGLNIVVSDSVSGNVTLRLQNVPWDQALDILLQAKSLDKRENGNVIWVAPQAEIAAREQQLLQALKEKRELEPLRSTFIQVNYAKATDLAEIIQSAASGSADDGGGLLSPRGSVTVDERTNILLLTDTPDRLDEIRNLVTRLDRPVRQIQIESRIVIATDTFSDEIGVRFGLTGGYEDNDGNVISVAGSANATDRMNNLALVNRQINPDRSSFPVIGPDNPPAGISIPTLGERLNVNLPASDTASRWAVGILTSDYLLDLELSALESEGRGEVISSPRLITANQREAFIQQGVEIPFQQASSSGATNISFKDAVLELRVQPLITPDNRVILDLAVKKDTVGQLVPVEGGGQVPSIDTREIQTQVLIDSGQTVVLGGIYEQTIREDSNKVPVLGDIPGLGVLFRQNSSQNDKAELLIFVTPTILNENVTLD